MKYQKTSFTRGAWVKASELVNGSKAIIISETNPQPSQFFNKDGSAKMQDVCKVRFEHLNEALNVSLNATTINGLVSAFGEDSINWQNQPLIVETEKVRVGGKAVVALYLIPEGCKKIDDENGYAIIVREGDLPTKEEIPVVENDDIPIENIPF